MTSHLVTPFAGAKASTKYPIALFGEIPQRAKASIGVPMLNHLFSKQVFA
jgi:hypothetical protein